MNELKNAQLMNDFENKVVLKCMRESQNNKDNIIITI